MELAYILRELWHRRRLLVPGLLVGVAAALIVSYQVSLTPPALKKKSHQLAVATTQLFIDAPRSTLGELSLTIDPLTVRTALYARVMTSPDAVRRIGQAAGMDPRTLVVEGPVEPTRDVARAGGTEERRADQIFEEGPAYRVIFEPERDLPILGIFAQAPTTQEAKRLTDGAAKALVEYVKDIQEAQNTVPSERVGVRVLGAADGGLVVGGGTDRVLTAMAFIGAFMLWCILVLVASGVARSWRDIDDLESYARRHLWGREEAAAAAPTNGGHAEQIHDAEAHTGA